MYQAVPQRVLARGVLSPACWLSLTALQVQYTALPHYEDKFEDFKADTVVLRRRFTPDGERFVGSGQGGDGFCMAAIRACKLGSCCARGAVLVCFMHTWRACVAGSGHCTGLTACAGDDTLVRAGDKLPADSLVLSTKNIWSIIKSQKDLNLPAHKVGARCGPPLPLHNS